jgi:hypothetical protein
MEEPLELELDPDLDMIPATRRGEVALVCAVVARAAEDLQHAAGVYRVLIGRTQARLGVDATMEHISNGVSADEWMGSDAVTPFSFLWCCSVLDQDPQRMRDRLRLGLQICGELAKHYETLALEQRRTASSTKRKLAGPLRWWLEPEKRVCDTKRHLTAPKPVVPDKLYAVSEQRGLLKFLYPSIASYKKKRVRTPKPEKESVDV